MQLAGDGRPKVKASVMEGLGFFISMHHRFVMQKQIEAGSQKLPIQMEFSPNAFDLKEEDFKTIDFFGQALNDSSVLVRQASLLSLLNLVITLSESSTRLGVQQIQTHASKMTNSDNELERGLAKLVCQTGNQGEPDWETAYKHFQTKQNQYLPKE